MKHTWSLPLHQASCRMESSVCFAFHGPSKVQLKILEMLSQPFLILETPTFLKDLQSLVKSDSDHSLNLVIITCPFRSVPHYALRHKGLISLQQELT